MPRTLTVTSDSLLFGKLNEPGYSYAFCGYLDRFRIWNCVRTQQEIQENRLRIASPSELQCPPRNYAPPCLPRAQSWGHRETGPMLLKGRVFRDLP